MHPDNVSSDIDPVPVEKATLTSAVESRPKSKKARKRAAAKLTNQLEPEQLKSPAEDLSTAMEDLRLEQPPPSMKGAQEEVQEREQAAGGVRSDSGKLVHEPTLSRSSSEHNCITDQSSTKTRTAAEISQIIVTPESSSTHKEPSNQNWTSVDIQPQVVSYDSAAVAHRKLNQNWLDIDRSQQALSAPKSAPSPRVRLTREEFEKRVAIPFKFIKRTATSPSLPITEESSSTTNPHSTTQVIMNEEDITSHNSIIHRRCASEASLAAKHMETTSSFDFGTAAIQDDSGDTSDEEAEGPTIDTDNSVHIWNGLRREPHAYTPWAGDIAWAYVKDHEEWETKTCEVTDFPVSYFVRPHGNLPPVEAAMRY